eukprot:scaffold190725_cov33-Tisochrysis_lutea.AAC.1
MSRMLSRLRAEVSEMFNAPDPTKPLPILGRGSMGGALILPRRCFHGSKSPGTMSVAAGPKSVAQLAGQTASV